MARASRRADAGALEQVAVDRAGVGVGDDDVRGQPPAVRERDAAGPAGPARRSARPGCRAGPSRRARPPARAAPRRAGSGRRGRTSRRTPARRTARRPARRGRGAGRCRCRWRSGRGRCAAAGRAGSAGRARAATWPGRSPRCRGAARSARRAMSAGPPSADSRNGPRLASQTRAARSVNARQSSPAPGAERVVEPGAVHVEVAAGVEGCRRRSGSGPAARAARAPGRPASRRSPRTGRGTPAASSPATGRCRSGSRRARAGRACRRRRRPRRPSPRGRAPPGRAAAASPPTPAPITTTRLTGPGGWSGCAGGPLLAGGAPVRAAGAPVWGRRERRRPRAALASAARRAWRLGSAARGGAGARSGGCVGRARRRRRAPRRDVCASRPRVARGRRVVDVEDDRSAGQRGGAVVGDPGQAQAVTGSLDVAGRGDLPQQREADRRQRARRAGRAPVVAVRLGEDEDDVQPRRAGDRDPVPRASAMTTGTYSVRTLGTPPTKSKTTRSKVACRPTRTAVRVGWRGTCAVAAGREDGAARAPGAVSAPPAATRTAVVTTTAEREMSSGPPPAAGAAAGGDRETAATGRPPRCGPRPPPWRGPPRAVRRAAPGPSRSACRGGRPSGAHGQASSSATPTGWVTASSGRPPVRRAVTTRPATAAGVAAAPAREPRRAASGGTTYSAASSAGGRRRGRCAATSCSRRRARPSRRTSGWSRARCRRPRRRGRRCA